MDKQNRKTKRISVTTVIAIVSVLLNVYLIYLHVKSTTQDNNDKIHEIVVEEKMDDHQDEEKKEAKENIVEEVDEDKKEENGVEYIYKYLEGKEKEVLVEKEVVVEKEVEKIIEVPASSTDAFVIYIDSEGNEETIELPSGTTIDFSAGEHGTYDSVPAPITLTDNQELDITDSSYNPSKVEVNYIFKGFSYSGNTMTCMYSLASNTVNVECKRADNSIINNNIIYLKQEYIESTGTQYIDTNYLPNNNTSVECEYYMNDVANNAVFFSATTAWTTNVYSFYRGAITVYTGYGNEEKGFSISNSGRHTVRKEKNKCYFDGTIICTHPEQTFQSTKKLRIGNVEGRNDYAFYGKIYYCKIWDNGDLKRDYIPAERVADGEVGLLDLEGGLFYKNAGSGVFKYSNNKPNPGINVGKVMASGSYINGSSLTLTAIANDGYTFVGWSDGSVDPTKEISVASSTVYTALFKHE